MIKCIIHYYFTSKHFDWILFDGMYGMYLVFNKSGMIKVFNKSEMINLFNFYKYLVVTLYTWLESAKQFM